jgi:hypothetical protein
VNLKILHLREARATQILARNTSYGFLHCSIALLQHMVMLISHTINPSSYRSSLIRFNVSLFANVETVQELSDILVSHPTYLLDICR